jgi:ABC-2 type transport system permease protein
MIEKYFKIYKSFIRTGLIADMEFRANFIMRFIGDLFWYTAQIVSFEVLYQHTSTIGSWTVEQTRVFLGMLFVVDALYMIIFHDNLDHMSEKVRKGELDLLLTKPVNSQFMVSLQKVLISQTTCLTVSLLWLWWALWQLPGLEPLRLFWLILMIPCGLISSYAVKFVISASAVIFTKSDNLQFIWYQIYKLGMRPDGIYYRWIRYLIMSLVPVAFIASVPSHLIFSAPDFGMVFWVVSWSLFLLWFSNRFWKFALQHYQSASS